jgi:hypothetical protein
MSRVGWHLVAPGVAAIPRLHTHEQMRERVVTVVGAFSYMSATLRPIVELGPP